MRVIETCLVIPGSGECNPSRVLNSQDHVPPAKERSSKLNLASEPNTPCRSNLEENFPLRMLEGYGAL